MHLLYCATGSGESKDRIAGPLSLVQQDTQSIQGLQQALDLNLARALMLSSRCAEACDKFKSLDITGMLSVLMLIQLKVCTTLLCSS